MNAMRLSIAHVASEMAPLVKVGGLADVVGALSLEQARRGHRVTVVLPWYRSVQFPGYWNRTPIGTHNVPWGMGEEPARFEVCQASSGGPRVLLVGHAGPRHFFDRPGVYDDPRTGEGYADNAERFLFFSRAALVGLQRLGERIDVLHAHDQQGAWIPYLARAGNGAAPFANAATVFTIHNLGYQGIHDPFVLGLAGVARDRFHPSSPFEFWGRVNFMKVGLTFADMLSTVSPRYAVEIRSSEVFGFGLEGVLSARGADLRGILNGIDVERWNPAADSYLPAAYDAESPDGKDAVRHALRGQCGFPDDGRPLIGMVSRLAEQKGFDLIDQAADALMGLEARFVVLGMGQPRYHEMLERLAGAHPDRVYFQSGHDEAFAHLIEGGADMFLMPSRYEPCGLNQMYSLRYGTPPVARAVGGLVDTVREFDPATGEGTGFLFREFESRAMVEALKRAIAVHKQPQLWRTLMQNGMRLDFSWRRSAEGYDALYAEARRRVAAGRRVTPDGVRTTP